MRIQKGRLRFNKRELWNVDDTLSKIIVSALEQFKSIPKHTIPPHLYTDIHGKETNKVEDLKYTDDEYNAEWLWLLNTMQDGFKPSDDYHKDLQCSDMTWCSLFNPEKFDGDDPESIRNGVKMHEVRWKLKDGVTQEEYDKCQELRNEWLVEQAYKREQGRKYFIAYFDSLWD